MKRLVSVQDLIEEAKVRALWWGICIFAISYFLSHTSKSMWMNIPIAVLTALTLRTLANEVEFRWKVPSTPRQSYLSYLEKKQLPLNDSHFSTSPPPPRWKRKIDSPIVEAALQEFIDKVLRDFVVDLWYSDITPDKEAPELMHAVIMDALGEVAGRVKEVNLVDLLTRDMIDLVGDHIELYRRTQATIGVDVMRTLSTEERDERLKHHLMVSNELHPALVSPESEYKFLQQIMGGLLTVVLRQREAQVPLVRCIARELLTCLVIQPILNLVSPMYINELIEYVVLNLEAFSSGMDVNGQSSKAYQDLSTSTRHHMSPDMALDKLDAQEAKASGNSESPSSGLTHGEAMHRSADWARILDAATQRRTEVLAPENLENLWARGRNYKNKLNIVDRRPQTPAEKGLVNLDTMLMKDPEEAVITNRHGTTGLDNKTLIQLQRGPNLGDVIIGRNTGQMELSQDVDEKLTFKGGPFVEEMRNTDAASADKHRRKLKRSSSALALKTEPHDKRAATDGNNGLIISEDFYSPSAARQSGEHEIKSPPDTMIHAQGSHFPKLRCRVIGAFFEKIGSKSFAVYSIAVTDAENNTWFVKRRYRNFERLHRHLKDIPNYNLHLPPKRIFSSSTEDKFVHKRCIQLDKYLQDLLSIANVAEQHEVWDFISASSKNYSFGKSPSVMRTLAVNVDDAVDDIVRQVKGASDELMRKVVGSSSSHQETSLYLPHRNLSWNADELRRHESAHSSAETTNSHSDNEEGDEDHSHACDEASCSPQANGWHSDNELNSKDFPPRVVKRIEDSRCSGPERKPGLELKSELKETSHSVSLPVSFGQMEDPMGVPPEWTPPNVTVPVLNLVDKIFQLNRRGWIRRQVFWISKQILHLVMEDAIDDILLSQIHWLRNEDVIAQGIRWVQDVLWPDDKFFLKLEVTQRKLDECGIEHKSSSTARRSTGHKASAPGSFEAQLEAIRRANYVRKLLFDEAPTALVSLVGHKQYRRCARDIYYFLQSPICVKQLAYGGLELILISLFPELRDLLVNTHKKMRAQPT